MANDMKSKIIAWGVCRFQQFFVILQCNSQRVAQQMNRISGTNETSSPSVKNWGYLENWKSTAPVKARV